MTTNIVQRYIKRTEFPINLNFHRYGHLKRYLDGWVAIESLFFLLTELGIYSSSSSCGSGLPAVGQDYVPCSDAWTGRAACGRRRKSQRKSRRKGKWQEHRLPLSLSSW